MTITKDHKKGFAVAVVLLLVIYFLFLRKGKTSNYKEGGDCGFNEAGTAIIDCTSTTQNPCFGTWTNGKCVGKGGALGTHNVGTAHLSQSVPSTKKLGILSWLFS